MRTDVLRLRLTRALMVALAAPVGACCEVKELRSQIAEGDPRFGAAASTCEAVCTAGPRCPDAPQLARCTMTGAPGSRVAVCVYEQSDCPTRPGPWGACGRRCEGATRDAQGPCDDPLGALFASMAALEAESVPAFERLADELAAHDAPRDLVRAARSAADDERRHARAMTALAGAHGAEVPAVRSSPTAPRPLLDVALENAAEGCVRETFGALVALWQAERASDPKTRAVMRAIAGDELRHASLGWRVDAWASARLSGDERARTQAARREATRALRASFGQPDGRVIERAGYPSRHEALRLLDACEAHVWQEAS